MLNSFVNQGTDKMICDSLVKSEQTYGPDDFEKRTINISGHPRYLDKIERMLAYMERLGNMGHSTSFNVFVDGDGAFRVNTKRDNKELTKIHTEDKYTEKTDQNDDIISFRFD